MKILLVALSICTSFIAFGQNETKSNTADKVFLPVKNDNKLKLVECLVNFSPVEFIFDTGASSTTMSQSTFLNLIKQGLSFEFVEEKSFVMANGSTSSADIYKSSTFSIGGYQLRDVTFAVINQSNAPNLLGQNVFNRFESYVIHDKYIELFPANETNYEENQAYIQDNAANYVKNIVGFSILTNISFFSMLRSSIDFIVEDPVLQRNKIVAKNYVSVNIIMPKSVKDYNSYDIDYKAITDNAIKDVISGDICFMEVTEPDFTHQKFLVANVQWIECNFIYKFKNGNKEDKIILLIDDLFLSQCKKGGLICEMNYFRDL
jgi:hypothetical protein